ncbi:integrase core domain protein (plasmid) [Sinorhizobium sp. RAC02]|nr:integrase core domain protein [Sinorhizobium sp. RAC02]
MGDACKRRHGHKLVHWNTGGCGAGLYHAGSRYRSRGHVDARPIVHSDRGARYRWPGWVTRVGDAKLVRSMSRKGCSQDNAACEGFFGRKKKEFFYPRDWRATTIEQFVREVDAYIHWYNEKRIKLSLGALSPIEYRNRLGLNAYPIRLFIRIPYQATPGQVSVAINTSWIVRSSTATLGGRPRPSPARCSSRACAGAPW